MADRAKRLGIDGVPCLELPLQHITWLDPGGTLAHTPYTVDVIHTTTSCCLNPLLLLLVPAAARGAPAMQVGATWAFAAAFHWSVWLCLGCTTLVVGLLVAALEAAHNAWQWPDWHGEGPPPALPCPPHLARPLQTKHVFPVPALARPPQTSTCDLGLGDMKVPKTQLRPGPKQRLAASCTGCAWQACVCSARPRWSTPGQPK